jgi:hypothetical protein
MAGTAGLLGLRPRPSGRCRCAAPFSRATRSSRTLRFSSCRNLPAVPPCMAGTAGFEPANAGIKTPCLTTWRRPSNFFHNSRACHAAVQTFQPARQDYFSISTRGHSTLARCRPVSLRSSFSCAKESLNYSIATCNGDLFTPLATKPVHVCGICLATACASTSVAKPANTQAPVPVILEGENLSSQSSAAATSG